MLKFVSVNEMRTIEAEANRKGISFAQMMVSAGENLARIINREFSTLKAQGTLGLVGPGNNGGDTLVALAWLAENGWTASAFLMKPRMDADPLLIRLSQAGGKIYLVQPHHDFNTFHRLIRTHAVFLDGLLGTGTHLPLKPDAAALLSFAKRIIKDENLSIKVIAVDCPSGVDCDTGNAAPESIPAQLTVTMAAIKQGLLKFPAYSLVGKFQVADIGLPGSAVSIDSWNAIKTFIPGPSFIHDFLPVRALDSHKGTFGTTLISAGCINYPGAAFLAGKAAYLIGSGLVTMAVPKTVYSILAGHFPEATWLPLPEELGFVAVEAARVILPQLDRASALLIGPGFGLHNTSQEYLSHILHAITAGQTDDRFSLRELPGTRSAKDGFPPVVIDADALKLVSKIDHWWTILPPDSILTPHPGEMAALTGLSKEAIQEDRIQAAQKFSTLWSHIVVLKGAFTVIASPNGSTALIPVATPALARAGTGDVLAGLIAGLRAQGVEAFYAAVLGAWIHAKAGIQAGETLGNPASVLASDVLNAVPSVISNTFHN
jgi:ADP-dependent NAD(P)H-hydrate dehydratase / NAD(P)H-hydrate epimerase